MEGEERGRDGERRDGVEERMFKDGTWSLVVCHRIIGKERKEGNEKGQGEDQKEYIA